MAHVRKLLRDAVVTAVTGLSTTGARVYTSRVYPTQAAELPCLVVTTPSEDVAPQDLGLPGIVERRVAVEVLGMARDTSTLAATLDAIAEEVETTLGGGVTVSGKLIDLAYEGALVQFSGEVDQPVGTIALRFVSILYTTSNAPGTLVMA